MKNNGLQELFIEELRDMYSAERQIIQSLPKLIELASYPALKEALETHLKETQNQTRRIEKIFSILKMDFTEKYCEGMDGIIKEAKRLVEGREKSAILDVAIISAAQKVEHYEMASYGTLRSFAKHLSLGNDIMELLQTNLDEEGAADKLLTKIADGTFFTSGLNQEAAGRGH